MSEIDSLLPAPSPAGTTCPPAQAAVTRDFGEWVMPAADPAGTVPDDSTGVDAMARVRLMDADLPVPIHSTWMHGVLHGWKLAAHQGSSQLTRSAAQAGSSTKAQGQSRERIHPPSALASHISPDMNWNRARGAGPGPVAGPTQFPTSAHVQTRGNSVVADTAVAQGQTGVMSWPERMMRRITSHEGHTTVWVRDYRVRDAEIPVLIGYLLSQQEGLPVDRIMINGSEVWRLEPTPSKEPE